jgi:hypothetical protein
MGLFGFFIGFMIAFLGTLYLVRLLFYSEEDLHLTSLVSLIWNAKRLDSLLKALVLEACANMVLGVGLKISRAAACAMIAKAVHTAA